MCDSFSVNNAEPLTISPQKPGIWASRDYLLNAEPALAQRDLGGAGVGGDDQTIGLGLGEV